MSHSFLSSAATRARDSGLSLPGTSTAELERCCLSELPSELLERVLIHLSPDVAAALALGCVSVAMRTIVTSSVTYWRHVTLALLPFLHDWAQKVEAAGSSPERLPCAQT